MDQLKDFLKLAVKYRFWIVIVIAALMPMIGYFASAGSINEREQAKAGEVKSAFNDVKQYEAGIIPNSDWTSLTDERTGVLKKEIRQAWRLLYDQQAPLLTWPPEVAEKYTTWGPVWPEGVSPAEITLTNNTYAAVYPQYVDKVYQIFRPFNYETGEGIVVAPVKETLLRPVTFSASKPPTLGKVWAAQQKLWIQATVLDVVDKVNKAATNWDEAPIKQITGMEVANPKAQDQVSIAKGIALTIAPEIVRPGEEAAAASTSTASSGFTPGGDSDYDMMGNQMLRGAMMGPMDSMGGGSATAPEEVYIFEQTAGQQFREIPVYLAVLIEQARMLDLIEAFRRSPMSIQVVDFEMKRSTTKVVKPEKGQNNPGFSSLMGMGEMFYGGNAMMSGMMGMSRGGMQGGYGMMMGDSDMQGGMESMMRGMMGGRGGMMGGYGMMGGAAAKKPQGTSIAQEQAKKIQEKAKAQEKGADEKKATPPPSSAGFSDPYYNIVEVHVYGRARFYEPPPAEEPEPESIAAEGDPAGIDTEMPVVEGEAPVADQPPAPPDVDVAPVTEPEAPVADQPPAPPDVDVAPTLEPDPDPAPPTEPEAPQVAPEPETPAEAPNPGV